MTLCMTISMPDVTAKDLGPVAPPAAEAFIDPESGEAFIDPETGEEFLKPPE